MKRFMCGLLVGVMTLACAPTAFAKSGIKVNVDGNELVFDVEPQIINERLMVPMRVIFEKLNAAVEYIEEENAVFAQNGNRVIGFLINADYMEIWDGNSDAKYYAIDAPATIIDGRTLVPARAVAESFGCGVSWDAKTKTVYINTDGTIVKTEAPKIGKWVVTKETNYDCFDGLTGWVEYEYNIAGKTRIVTKYDAKGKVKQRNEYNYDVAKVKTEKDDMSSGSDIDGGASWEVEHDSAGNVTKVTYYVLGKVYRWYEMEYDSAGNMTKETEYSSDGSPYRWHEYEYKYV